MELRALDTLDGVSHVRTVGDIDFDLSAGSNVQDPLVELLGPQVFESHVVLHLDESEYISSCGIGYLLRCHKQFVKHGGRLELCSIPKAIDQVLRLMRLHALLNMIDAPSLVRNSTDG